MAEALDFGIVLSNVACGVFLAVLFLVMFRRWVQRRHYEESCERLAARALAWCQSFEAEHGRWPSTFELQHWVHTSDPTGGQNLSMIPQLAQDTALESARYKARQVDALLAEARTRHPSAAYVESFLQGHEREHDGEQVHLRPPSSLYAELHTHDGAWVDGVAPPEGAIWLEHDGALPGDGPVQPTTIVTEFDAEIEEFMSGETHVAAQDMERVEQLALELVESWHTADENWGTLHDHMRLSHAEYVVWIETSVLPLDFLQRHAL